MDKVILKLKFLKSEDLDFKKIIRLQYEKLIMVLFFENQSIYKTEND